MNPHWIDAPLYQTIQDTVPIACADIVPLEYDPAGRLARVGLIFRDTPWGPRWCTLGGRIRRNESLAEAVARQIHETLGSAAEFTLPEDIQPAWIAQYFTAPRPEVPHGVVDPRQHAIGLIFAVEIGGDLSPQGEAVDFRWFAPSELPPQDQFGFQQRTVVDQILRRATSPPD